MSASTVALPSFGGIGLGPTALLVAVPALFGVFIFRTVRRGRRLVPLQRLAESEPARFVFPVRATPLVLPPGDIGLRAPGPTELRIHGTVIVVSMSGGSLPGGRGFGAEYILDIAGSSMRLEPDAKGRLSLTTKSRFSLLGDEMGETVEFYIDPLGHATDVWRALTDAGVVATPR